MREDLGILRLGKFQFILTKTPEDFRALVLVLSSGSSTYTDTIYSERLEDLPFLAVDYAFEHGESGSLYVTINV